MNLQINQLVRTLLKKESLDDCSLDELEQYAERYPYFGAAQLLLAKKLRDENSEKYEEQLQKTFLFFHNPLWVQHLLDETGSADVTVAEKEESILTPAVDETVTTNVAKETGVQFTQKVNEPVIILPGEEIIIRAGDKADLKINSDKEEIETGEEIEPDEKDDQDETQVEVEKEAGTSKEVEVEKDDEFETQVEVEKGEEPEKEVEIEKESKASAEEKIEVAFEPYHTVDYFASQGIKYKAEEKPPDKLGQQLKSFTDWLKTMKRLPVTEISKNIPVSLEKKVEQLAEHSLDEKEVVTETMAEVWEKQGNAAKAAEVYQKLSLLDPSKSAYFAAKIDDLKKKT